VEERHKANSGTTGYSVAWGFLKVAAETKVKLNQYGMGRVVYPVIIELHPPTCILCHPVRSSIEAPKLICVFVASRPKATE
jgi:hypothetical protein